MKLIAGSREVANMGEPDKLIEDKSTEPGPQAGSTRVWWYAMPGMFAVLALLRFYPLAQMNYSGLLVVVLVLGWLAYHYFAPLQFITRHALLSHVTADDSVMRRLLWNSFFLKFKLALSSLLVALLVLSLTSELPLIEWLVLLVSVPVFMMLVWLAQRMSGSESNQRYHFPFSMRIAHWMTLLLITMVLVAVKLFWSDVADTRLLSLQEVMQQAFDNRVADAALREVGWLLGVNAAVNDGSWHLMQTASGSVDSPVGIKLAAWTAFLFFNALKIGMVWIVLGGVVLLVAEHAGSKKSILGGNAFSRSFSLSMLILFVFYLLLTQVNVGRFLPASVDVSFLPVRLPDPCENQMMIERQELRQQSRQALSQQQADILARFEARINQKLDVAFQQAEPGVDRFLDWNFSLRGQYAQLMYMGASAIGEITFSDYVAGKMDEHVGDRLAPMIGAMDEELGAEFMGEMQNLYAQQAAVLESLAGSASCLNLAPPGLSLNEYMSKSPVGAGSGAGILAARASMRVGSRVVSRTASRRVVSSAFARLTGRAATSAAAGSTGVLCGPLVWVCAPALAAGAWVATDLAINEIDQAMNREDMRQDMLAVLNEERVQLRQQLVDHYALALGQVADEIERYQDQRFNILRDGV
jgi:hypothetical protein